MKTGKISWATQSYAGTYGGREDARGPGVSSLKRNEVILAYIPYGSAIGLAPIDIALDEKHFRLKYMGIHGSWTH